jgi:uncharacterized protein YjaG (DUF416 family)
MPHREVKNLDDYHILLSETLTPWSPAQHIALVAGLAERWLPTYASFSAEEDWGDPASLRRSLDAVWAHVAGRPLTSADANRHLGQIEEITPHMDDCDDGEDALIACIVVGDALRACSQPANTFSIVVHSLLGVFEGLVEEWPVEPAAEQRIWKKTVIRKELQSQLALLDEIAALPDFTAESLAALRGRLAKQASKPKPAPKPKGTPALTNQTLFEQYRRMVESDLKSNYRDPNDPEPGTYLFAITYLGYWLGRYSRRMQTLNGSYGRWADEPGQRALAARNRAVDAAEGRLDWSPDVREAIEMCLSTNVRMNVVDAGSVDAPHPSGPSMRRLWIEGRWKRIREWADHRPAVWESEDRRKKKGLTHSASELGAILARDIEWQPTADPLHPWSAVIDGVPCRIRINDYPDELLYTLLLGDTPAGDFHDWPERWKR